MRPLVTAGKRLLVVDDEPSVRDLLSRVLGRAGYAVEVVETGEAAVEALGKSSYYLLLVDKNLPGISGYEVARRARAATPDVAVAMMTAVAERIAPDQVNLLDHYIAKPFKNLKEITDAVELAFAASTQARERRKMERQLAEVRAGLSGAKSRSTPGAS